MAAKASVSPPDGGVSSAFRILKAAASGLPDVVESTSYGTPALKVGKKLMARVKDADTVVLICPLDEKEMLLEVAPEIYFETDHYRGWPAVLVRIHAIPADELSHRIEQAWTRQAPRKLVAARQASQAR
ncbi:MmcQ/YjbR family DNA-binding protein [Mesorhizobium sp.]|uniref:MmcQ/YjbR family DNA-binding protein n=1 Tax=Mesorhizobium sp. TaxID=1871066 RepID=UPI0025E39E0A|nr:MmcQ/YjbR family DNA-binding protein [Mesorhizobium sp.]